MSYMSPEFLFFSTFFDLFEFTLEKNIIWM